MPTQTALRSELRELLRLAGIDLASLWGGITDPDLTYRLLLETIPHLAEIYGTAAATAAADWYDETRIEAGAEGRFRSTPASLPDPARYESLARWSVDPLTGQFPDSTAALQRALGGTQRIIANANRDTIMGSSLADPAAQGWRRMASSHGCGFCRMLADRGAVYTKSSVDFGAHDGCSCVAVPAFGGDTILTDRKVSTTRNISDADRARTREWMAQHGY